MAFDVDLRESGASFNVVLITETYYQDLLPIKNQFALNQANGCEDGTTTGFRSYKSATISATTDEKYQGSYSLKIVTPGTQNDEGFDTYPYARVLPSYIITASVWLKGSGNVHFWLTEWDADGVWVGEYASNKITLTGTWTRYTLTRQVDPDCRLVNINVDTAYDESAQAITFYADAMQIEYNLTATTWESPSATTSVSLAKPRTSRKHLAPIKNLLSLNQANGCEDGTTTGFAAERGSTLSADATEYYQGSYSIKVVTPNVIANEGVCNYPLARVIPSSTYTISVWLKGSGTVYLWGTEWEEDGSFLRDWRTGVITLTGTWTRYSLTHTVGSDCFKLNIYVDTDVKQAITYYCDAWQIECSGVVTDWGLPSTTTSVLLTPEYQPGVINQNVSASLTFTPSLLRVPTYWRTISANSTFTTTLSRALTLGRILLANATFTTAILRNGYKTLSANATFTVTLSRLITAYRSIAASLASNVSIGTLKTKSITLSASLASTVSLVRGISLNMTLSVTEAATVSLLRGISLYRTLSASSTFTSVLNAVKQAGYFYQNVSATATFTVSIVRKMYRTLSVSGTFTVIISRAITIYRTISANATFTVAISKLTTTLRTLSTNATFTVGVVKSLTIYRVLSVVETAAVSLSRTLSMKRTLSVTEEPVPTLSRFIQIKRAFSNVVSFITNLLYVKNPIPPEYPCVNLDCHLTPSETLNCHLTPSVSIDCETDDKEINLNCSLRCN